MTGDLAAMTSLTNAKEYVNTTNDTVSIAKAFISFAYEYVADAMTDETAAMSSVGAANTNYPPAIKSSKEKNTHIIHAKYYCCTAERYH